MTEEDAIKQLKECDNSDPELAHYKADEILCELLKSCGYTKVVDEWDKISKWYA